MKKLKLFDNQSGQIAAIGIAVTLIISLAVCVVVVANLFGGVPLQSENSEAPNYISQEGMNAYQNVQNLSWAGIGLLSIAILVMAATVILSIVRGGFSTTAGGV